MSDHITLPLDAVRWLHELARERELGDGWHIGEPYKEWEELLAMGIVECRPSAYRLSEIGWWTMNRLVLEGEDGP